MKVRKIENPPFAVYGPWEVYADGTLKRRYKTPLGREELIHIYPDRLSEPDLIINLMVNRVETEWNNLMPAFFTACRMAGIKTIPNFQIDFD
jgi:hypothetical protein